MFPVVGEFMQEYEEAQEKSVKGRTLGIRRGGRARDRVLGVKWGW